MPASLTGTRCITTRAAENGPYTPQIAMAASINTAYSDLWHTVGGRQSTPRWRRTSASTAQLFGLHTASCGITGPAMVDQAGVALGQASLTVGEQATMLATLDDNGIYHDAHVITSITQNNAPPTPIKITSYPVFSSNPTLNSEEGTAGAVRDVAGHGVLRHGADRRAEQRPGDHRQDRHHQHRPVGVLHRRHPEPGPGRRAVHQRAGQGSPRPSTTSAASSRTAATAAPGRPRSGTPTPRTSSSRWGSSSSPCRSSPAACGTRCRRACARS